MSSQIPTSTDSTNHTEWSVHDPVRELFPMDEYVSYDTLVLDDPDTSKNWTSLYIPVVPNNLYLSNPKTRQGSKFHAKYLKSFIENNLCLGSVKRIDFVDRTVDNSDVPVKSAYIHFHYWFSNEIALKMRENLNQHGKHRQNGYFSNVNNVDSTLRTSGSKFYKVLPNGSYASGYFVFKINHKPIEEADYDANIHQIAAANKILEQKLKEKDAFIQAFRDNLNVKVPGLFQEVLNSISGCKDTSSYQEEAISQEGQGHLSQSAMDV